MEIMRKVTTMKNEVWRPVDGFEGYYEVSNYGRVRSIKRIVTIKNRWHDIQRRYGGTITRGHIDNNGYMAICLQADGRKKYTKVHILVAKAFIENPSNYHQVNHKDENKSNNCVENLEWCTAKYNSNYGTKIKRQAEKWSRKVNMLKDGKIVSTFPSLKEAGERMNINYKNIQSVCAGHRKTAGGYNWEYAE